MLESFAWAERELTKDSRFWELVRRHRERCSPDHLARLSDAELMRRHRGGLGGYFHQGISALWSDWVMVNQDAVCAFCTLEDRRLKGAGERQQHKELPGPSGVTEHTSAPEPVPAVAAETPNEDAVDAAAAGLARDNEAVVSASNELRELWLVLKRLERTGELDEEVLALVLRDWRTTIAVLASTPATSLDALEAKQLALRLTGWPDKFGIREAELDSLLTDAILNDIAEFLGFNKPVE